MTIVSTFIATIQETYRACSIHNSNFKTITYYHIHRPNIITAYATYIDNFPSILVSAICATHSHHSITTHQRK